MSPRCSFVRAVWWYSPCDGLNGDSSLNVVAWMEVGGGGAGRRLHGARLLAAEAGGSRLSALVPASSFPRATCAHMAHPASVEVCLPLLEALWRVHSARPQSLCSQKLQVPVQSFRGCYHVSSLPAEE